MRPEVTAQFRVGQYLEFSVHDRADGSKVWQPGRVEGVSYGKTCVHICPLHHALVGKRAERLGIYSYAISARSRLRMLPECTHAVGATP